MVAQPLTERLFTEDEYLMIEAQSDFRSEFHNGRIYAMPGGTSEHSIISVRILSTLDGQLTRRGCIVYNNDMQVRVPSGNNYYPDVSALCGPADLRKEVGKPQALYNPTLIIEVLSDSTETFDRSVKFDYYQSIPSLHYYLMVAQTMVKVDLYTRVANNDWHLHIATDLDAVLKLPALNAHLALKDIYLNTLYRPDAQTPG
jgi:Uma2 family endonuclease